MCAAGSVTNWLNRLPQGDEEAARRLWERYCHQLIQLARRNLRGTPRREADEEDVVLSAFDSFCRGVCRGNFPRLADREDLWQLLVMITLRKAADQRQRNRRLKRGGGLQRGDSVFLDSEDPTAWKTIDAIIGKEPTPEMAVMAADQLRYLLGKLDSQSLTQVALWKMEGYTNNEIATKLGCQLRTVERKISLIRKIWSAEQ